jgi:selenophosphate synthetase-related protein
VTKKQNSKAIIKRMEELMEPIDRQIMMCDNAEDVLMLASNMLITAKGIYVQNLGGAVAKILLQQIVDNIDDRILPMGGEVPPFDGK